jgi:hypothetical protein
LIANCPGVDAIAGDGGVADDALYAEAISYIANGSCSDVAVSTATTQVKAVKTRLAAPWVLNNEQ